MFTIISFFQKLIKGGVGIRAGGLENFSKINKRGGGRLFGTRENKENKQQRENALKFYHVIDLFVPSKTNFATIQQRISAALQVGLGAANRRRNRGNKDDEEEGLDFSQYEAKSEEDVEEENDQNKANDVNAGESKGPRIPKGLKVGEQPVAQMENASMRMRRSK